MMFVLRASRSTCDASLGISQNILAVHNTYTLSKMSLKCILESVYVLWTASRYYVRFNRSLSGHDTSGCGCTYIISITVILKL